MVLYVLKYDIPLGKAEAYAESAQDASREQKAESA